MKNYEILLKLSFDSVSTEAAQSECSVGKRVGKRVGKCLKGVAGDVIKDINIINVTKYDKCNDLHCLHGLRGLHGPHGLHCLHGLHGLYGLRVCYGLRYGLPHQFHRSSIGRTYSCVCNYNGVTSDTSRYEFVFVNGESCIKIHHALKESGS